MGNEAIENKIRKLYERATSATNGDERAERDADNALALAQKLAAKHSIDLEMLRQQAKARGEKVAKPERKRFSLAEGPYIRPRAGLASRIALSMGMKTLIAHSGDFIDIIGFSEDIEMAWQIFGLVEPQMMNAADRRIERGEHRQLIDLGTRAGHVSAKTFKMNYFTSYTNRVARRIEASRHEAEEDVVLADGVTQDDGSTTGRVTGALVLVGRKAEVEKFFAELVPVKKFKNGKEKKPKYWKAPKASVRVDAARQAGARDGQRARIQLGGEIQNERRALR